MSVAVGKFGGPLRALRKLAQATEMEKAAPLVLLGVECS